MKCVFDLINRLDSEEVSPLDILLATCRDIANKISADLVSIWFFNTNYQTLECACYYNKETGDFTSGQIIKAKDYPLYFNTIISDKFLLISDARNHKTTSKFTESYFIENDIYSVLDFTIHDKHYPTGVISCEKAGEIYHWKESDFSYLRQLSTLVSHYIDPKTLTIKSHKKKQLTL